MDYRSRKFGPQIKRADELGARYALVLGESELDKREQAPVDLVGPLCEGSDFLALARTLPLPRRGDLLALGLAGAYGRVMSSAYNARPLCAEVVLERGRWRISRERGTYDDLVRNEHT